MMGLAYWGKQFSKLGSKVLRIYTKWRTIPMPDLWLSYDASSSTNYQCTSTIEQKASRETTKPKTLHTKTSDTILVFQPENIKLAALLFYYN